MGQYSCLNVIVCLTLRGISMLKIKDLCANIENKQILKGIDLEVKAGEIHAIMGPNGSGKSTLAQILAGRDSYDITKGTVKFKGKDLLELDPEERAREGIFMAFQYPVEIPGVSCTYFLKTALNSIREHQGKDPLDAADFLAMIRDKMNLLGIDQSLINRSVNEGFSGGEKKRNEIFQLQVLNPDLAILDETDSGLDIDALKIVASGVKQFKQSHNAVIMVTHYQRLLSYIKPDYVHVLYDGRVVKSGGKELAIELEKSGYDEIKVEVHRSTAGEALV